MRKWYFLAAAIGPHRSPDVRLLPAEALSFHRALSRHGRKILGYGDPRGHERLRGQLATMLSHSAGSRRRPRTS